MKEKDQEVETEILKVHVSSIKLMKSVLLKSYFYIMLLAQRHVS